MSIYNIWHIKRKPKNVAHIEVLYYDNTIEEDEIRFTNQFSEFSFIFHELKNKYFYCGYKSNENFQYIKSEMIVLKAKCIDGSYQADNLTIDDYEQVNLLARLYLRIDSKTKIEIIDLDSEDKEQ